MPSAIRHPFSERHPRNIGSIISIDWAVCDPVHTDVRFVTVVTKRGNYESMSRSTAALVAAGLMEERR
jgi:hypothetical protein